MNISNAPRQHTEHPENISRLLNNGKELLKIQENNLACQTFQRAVQLHPCQHTNTSHGLALFKLKKYGEAMQAFDQALEFEPNDPKAHRGRAFILLETKEYGRALEAFTQALKLKENNPKAHCGRAFALLDLGKYSDALRAFNQALKRKENNPEAHYGYGKTLSKLGLYNNAIKAFDQALAIKNDFPLAKSGREDALFRLVQSGLVLLQLDDYEKAIETFDKALEIARTPSTYLNRSYAFYKLGQYENAKNDALGALALDNTCYEGHYWLGNILIELRQYAKAIETFDKALEIKKTANAYLKRSWNFYKLGKFENAKNDALEALALDNTCYEGHYWLGMNLIGLGKYTEAIEAFKKTLQIMETSNAYTGIGKSLMRIGQYPEAIEAFDKALALTKDHKEAQRERLNVLLKLDQQADARNQSPAVESNIGEAMITPQDIQITEPSSLRDSNPGDEGPPIKRGRDQKDLFSDEPIDVDAPAEKKRKTSVREDVQSDEY